MKNKIGLNLTSLLLLTITLVGCAVTDFDKSVNFNQYRTFAWGKSEIKTSNPVYNSDLINKNIQATVENEFAKRGIIKSDNAEFIVSYQTYTEKKQQNYGPSYMGGHPFFPLGFYRFGWGWGPWGLPYGMYNSPRSETVTEGTLIIDITDRKTNELIWRGTVSGNVDNVSNLQKQIQKGIKAIMKKYPVPADDKLQLNERVIS